MKTFSRAAGCLTLMLMALSTTACERQPHAEGAHAHGSGRLSIAVESANEGSILFEAPAESIYGFEYAPSSPEDIEAQSAALAVFESEIDSLFRLPAELACSFDVISVAVEGEEDAAGRNEDGAQAGAGARDLAVDEHEGDAAASRSGEHSEVVASYGIVCQGPLEGAELQVLLGEVFPGLEDLDVTLLGGEGQRGLELEGAVGSVKLD